jgi:hypothetical protein
MRSLILACAAFLAACTTLPSEPAAAAGKPTALHVTSATVTEGQPAALTISATGGNGRAMSVKWTTANASAAGAVSVSVSHPAVISVPVPDDTIVNGTRTLPVTATASSGANASGTITILDNDVAPPAPTQTCPDGSVIPATDVCPSPTFTPSSSVAPTLNGLPDIPSGFDEQTTLTGQLGVNLPPSNNGNDLGAFRFQCTPGPLAYNDPIVFPGQSGKSHLHQAFGNTTSLYADSNYEALRSRGKSTCQDPNAPPANRSGYWIPALLNGLGYVIQPDAITIYYKRWPVTDFHCGAKGGFPTTFNVGASACTAVPNGMRFIMGFNMLNPGQAPTGAVQFLCGEQMANFETMTQALDRCRAISASTGGITHLIARMEAPDCWNGHDLDSADHRTHVAYASYGDWGYRKCDIAHPIAIPTFTMTVNYTILPGDNTKLWQFSSDAMVAGAAPGTTFHGDFFSAWAPFVRGKWENNCLNKDLDCQSGQVGDGFGIRGADAAHYLMPDGSVVTPPTGAPNPNRLVPIPARGM